MFRRRLSLLLAVVLGSILLLAACSKAKRNGSSSGRVYVTIFQPNASLLLDEVGFEFDLSLGSVRQSLGRGIDAARIPDGRSNDTNVAQASAVNSPNNAYAASSTVEMPRVVGYPHAVFVVRNLITGETVFQSKFTNDEIDGVMWSADSNAVAVLTSSQRYSRNPKYWLDAVSGHPRPIEDYHLEIVDLSTRSSWGIDLPYESSAGHGRIVDWLPD